MHVCSEIKVVRINSSNHSSLPPLQGFQVLVERALSIEEPILYVLLVQVNKQPHYLFLVCLLTSYK
jgi:hypothetical protein